MTHDKAKDLLGATRPRDEALARESGDAEICAAFEALREDTGLGEWYRAECVLDEAIAARIQSALAAPPDYLRERLIASLTSAGAGVERKIIPLRSWAAIAAGLVLFGGVGIALRDGWFQEKSTPASFAKIAPVKGAEFVSFRESMSDYANGKIRLAMKNEDTIALAHWAQENAGPIFENLPAKMGALPGIGCAVIDWDGRKVSLFCFRNTENGHVAHLFVVDRAAFAELPATENLKKPQVCCELESLAWDDAQRVYLLVADKPGLPVSEFF